MSAACSSREIYVPDKLSIGIVTYDEGARSIDQYSRFQEYLAGQLKSIIELEPALNELKALERIQRRIWSLVFAPPGLAALAIANQQYIPLFALEGTVNSRSLLVVLNDSPYEQIVDLNGKALALGQRGSATGYYLPIYDLYGLTLKEVLFGTTPKAILELVDQGKVAAGALSKEEFEQHSREFSSQRFRILHTSSQAIPPGAVLLGPDVERNRQEEIVLAMETAPPNIIAEAGYIANSSAANYEFLIEVVKRVQPIVTRIHEQPVPLYEREEDRVVEEQSINK
jgi:phosphonate transport system substrate-binding protein